MQADNIDSSEMRSGTPAARNCIKLQTLSLTTRYCDSLSERAHGARGIACHAARNGITSEVCYYACFDRDVRPALCLRAGHLPARSLALVRGHKEHSCLSGDSS